MASLQTDTVETLALFNEQLSTLHRINLELSLIDSFDEMCRQAVIAWHDHLKLDRIGIWFICPERPGYLCGSFGLDETGQVRDERDQMIEKDAPIFEEISSNQQRVYYKAHHKLLNHRSQLVGYGETAAAALWDGHTVIGFVVIDNLISQRPITSYQRDILYLFGQMIGHLASQKRSEKLIRENERQYRLLNEMTYAAISQADFRAMLQNLVDRFGELLEADFCYLTLWDESTGEVSAGALLGANPERRVPLASAEQAAQTLSVLETGEPLVEAEAGGGRSRLVLPLIANQRGLGAVFVEARAGQAFSPFNIKVAEDGARQIALAILKATLLEQTQQRLQETETLRQAGIAVASALKQDEAIERILEELNRVVPYDSATVQLKRDDRMEVVGARGDTDEQNIFGLSFPIIDSLPNGVVTRQKAPYILSDVPEEYSEILDIHHKGIRGWMGVPILLQDQVSGMLALCSCRPGNFTLEHARLATAFAAHVAITLENTRLFDEVQRLVTYDYLTGVYNRRHFMDLARRAFQRAGRYHEALTLIMLDVDHFKAINDVFGHLVGDQVLQKVAQTCLEQLRDSDTIGRYGGEEFVILLPQTTMSQTAAASEIQPALQIAERLRKAVEDLRFLTEGGEVNPTISIGIAERTSHCSELAQVIAQADLALLKSKSGGRNRITAAPVEA